MGNSFPLYNYNVSFQIELLPDEMSDLSGADKESLERMRQYVPEGKGYPQIQGTRPQTLAYGLNDSPVEQLAWIVEKFKEWNDPGPSIDEKACGVLKQEQKSQEYRPVV